jgi:uncharacterized protein DUF4198
MRIRAVLPLCLATLTVIPVGAHDFWLAATPWQPGSRVTISANLGEVFPVGTDHVTPDGVEQWRVLGPRGQVAGEQALQWDGKALAAEIVLAAPGAYLATMTTAAHVTTMNGPSFNSYLLEEGLGWAVAARRNAGVSENTATERYTRYAKVAVRNGFGTGAHLTRPVGVPAEFVPMTDPTLLRAGQLLTLQLLANGKPVRGATVTARSSGGGHPVLGLTDATGHVTLPIDREGAWLVRTVHMITGAEAGAPDVDWHSSWATLAFHTTQ